MWTAESRSTLEAFPRSPRVALSLSPVRESEGQLFRHVAKEENNGSARMFCFLKKNMCNFMWSSQRFKKLLGFF